MPPSHTNTLVDKSGIAVAPTDCNILSFSVYLCVNPRVHGMVVSLTVTASGSSTLLGSSSGHDSDNSDSSGSSTQNDQPLCNCCELLSSCCQCPWFLCFAAVLCLSCNGTFLTPLVGLTLMVFCRLSSFAAHLTDSCCLYFSCHQIALVMLSWIPAAPALAECFVAVLLLAVFHLVCPTIQRHLVSPSFTGRVLPVSNALSPNDTLRM